ncbi:hypothetical protein PGTUg99_023910 [Puccinia graminis f. sp. tritici]|uniref:rRNA-processing protein FYV7 n=1 Tax=Puccinia graminis f. sp. tritici TaxID=56615 RepID=A0A5B0R651_PUCGR|nr:hypothetical protein PGTUg99_023910 [Puccinia graminis f. sp. tritici]
MTIPPKKPTNQQDPSWKRSKGFRIGKNKPGVSQSVYLGKAEKIKKTLIHKAKLKKQRAKELAKAGYDTTTSGPAPESPTDNHQEDQPSGRTDSRRTQPGPSDSGRPKNSHQERPKDSSHPSTTKSQNSSNQHDRHHPKSSARAQQNHHPSSNELKASLKESTTKTRDPQQSNHHLKTPNRPARAKIQHANGQPKLSHRVSKILSKLEHEKEEDQSCLSSF